MAKQNKIVFMEGKEAALKGLFSDADTKTFCYLAVGYDNNSPGFENSDNDNGFKEINNDNTYKRVKLTSTGVEKDSDTGKVTVLFKGDLDYENIKTTTPINQLAVVDSSTPNDAHTIFYAATTFPEFNKNSQNAMTFVLGFKL